jgi:hypothetical protein
MIRHTLLVSCEPWNVLLTCSVLAMLPCPQVTPNSFVCKNVLRFQPAAIEALQQATEYMAVWTI